ncbi:hypothetical protein RclHR1_01160017 [Rhizophagus clarus]|uniref:Beta-flanking protein n=1 Tax=Rhizophagus clarus TaxID=94130 RepID=A0A2Z6Q4H0_9GLOM|nr:hypothetical protein RclHR1_01160017 [Rhizophagus clarus]GET01394.1 beta-flanking protein [Rhizophagus clarus]
MSFLDDLNDLKKKFLDDDKDESSFADKFKQFGHSDEDAALVQNVAHKAQQKVNEDDDDDDLIKAQDAHKKIYEHEDDDDDDAILGKAAAFEALKKYYSGSRTEKDKTELQKHFVAMAMSEGLEIWKKKQSESGEAAAGKKEEIMEQAAKAAIKMLMNSEKSEKVESKTESKTESITEEHSSHSNHSSHSKLTDFAKKFF